MKDYIITVGLEIHAELKTQTKMFCNSKNDPDEKRPNVNICPVCMGHPGTLPVINKEAVKHVLKVGAAVGGNLADYTEFDRKNYFYPDIPKGYQITQYKYPLVSGGAINGVALTRIHLEEDTARSTHDIPGVSLVDFNRAGVPLMELVTEPVMHSAAEAIAFAKELQLLLQYLDVSDANMERGQMRVEVNISVSKSEKFGTKVEIKNIASFRAAGRAIEFEFARQTKLLEEGGKVVQETRGWDENKQATVSQRLKESAHDYKYFPDPDLPKMIISEIPDFAPAKLSESLVELPWEKRTRYSKDFGIKNEDIEVYVNNREIGEFFEDVVSQLMSVGGESVKIASNYITSDLIGLSKTKGFEFDLGKITADSFAKLVSLVVAGELSSRGAKDVLKMMFESGGEPEKIAKEKGLIQKSNPEELRGVMEKILNENQSVVEEYKNGKESRLQFLIGQGMKATGGSANPEMLKKIILELMK